MYSVLPATVANELRHKHTVPARKFTPVTILFSGIVGFNEFCARHSDQAGALHIVTFLNDTYTRLDCLIDPKSNPNVYKVGVCVMI